MTRLLKLLLVVLLSAAALIPAPAGAQSPVDPARTLIAALNAWRLEADRWPLRPNATLTRMAQDQANYLASLKETPDDLHAGRRGESPRQRAAAAPYSWPTYGPAEQIAIGEIAYIGRTPAAAIAWWQGSDLHSRTVRNGAYREVGVGIAPHALGSIWVVVLGGRPNVLPAQIDPMAGVIYLSNEVFSAATRRAEWIANADRVRLFDAEGRPLSADWQAWNATLPLPSAAGERFFVAYTDGQQQTIAEVRPDQDRVLLPAALSQAAVPTATPPTAFAPAPLPTETTPQVAATPTALSLAPPQAPTRTPIPASPTASPIPSPDLQLIYDRRSLTLLNVSSAAADLSALVLVHTAGQLPISLWQTQWLSVSLAAFPAQDCLQVWGWNETAEPAQPGECRYRRSVITIDPARRFWATGPFDVLLGSTRLASCPAAPGSCSVDLP